MWMSYLTGHWALLLLEKFWDACGTLLTRPLHNKRCNVINYTVAIRFQTVLRDRFKNFSRYNSVSINSFSGFKIMLIKKHKRFLKYTFYLLDHELHEIYKIDKIDANIFNCRIATFSYYYHHWCTSNCSICAVTTNTIILNPWINYIGHSSCPGNLLYFNWKWKNIQRMACLIVRLTTAFSFFLKC